jgi:hypothetical protein
MGLVAAYRFVTALAAFVIVGVLIGEFNKCFLASRLASLELRVK